MMITTIATPAIHHLALLFFLGGAGQGGAKDTVYSLGQRVGNNRRDGLLENPSRPSLMRED